MSDEKKKLFEEIYKHFDDVTDVADVLNKEEFIDTLDEALKDYAIVLSRSIIA